jgi:hypothetical protein
MGASHTVRRSGPQGVFRASRRKVRRRSIGLSPFEATRLVPPLREGEPEGDHHGPADGRLLRTGASWPPAIADGVLAASLTVIAERVCELIGCAMRPWE